MSSAREIINAAYEELGILAEEEDLTPGDYALGLRRLNDVITVYGADIGITCSPVDSIDGEVGNPIETGSVISCKLASRLAPAYQLSSAPAEREYSRQLSALEKTRAFRLIGRKNSETDLPLGEAAINRGVF